MSGIVQLRQTWKDLRFVHCSIDHALLPASVNCLMTVAMLQRREAVTSIAFSLQDKWSQLSTVLQFKCLNCDTITDD